MTNALTLTELSFSFSETSATPFFSGLSVSFEKNKIHFIRGKNGAGKSTLFRILRGIIYGGELCSGTIAVGEELYNLRHADERDTLSDHIRMVPQRFDDMLADQYTFRENLQLAAMDGLPSPLRGLPAAPPIPPLVDRFGITYTTPVHLLSGGQRQILAILMALQRSASILLLDEPTAALDEKNAAMVMEFLTNLIASEKNLTILIICHDKELVETYATGTFYYTIAVDPHGVRSIVQELLRTP